MIQRWMGLACIDKQKTTTLFFFFYPNQFQHFFKEQHCNSLICVYLHTPAQKRNRHWKIKDKENSTKRNRINNWKRKRCFYMHQTWIPLRKIHYVLQSIVIIVVVGANRKKKRRERKELNVYWIVILNYFFYYY